MIKKTFLFLFILSLTGCGLKIKSEVDDNILLGTWNLNRITCAKDEASEAELEKYIFDGAVAVTIVFSDSRVAYTAAGVCSTSTNGLYSTNFNGTSTGVLDITDVETAGVTCTESITDTGLSTVGNITITTSLIATYSKSLNWLITNERDILVLEYYGNFQGSTDARTCSGNCYCKGIFTKSP